jgi:predicted RecA/RadA family phage recombinase
MVMVVGANYLAAELIQDIGVACGIINRGTFQAPCTATDRRQGGASVALTTGASAASRSIPRNDS